MTYTLELPAEVEQVLAARAQESGVSVGKYLLDLVIREVASNSTTAHAAAAPHDEEMDALEELALELAAKYPRAEPLADDAVALAYTESRPSSIGADLYFVGTACEEAMMKDATTHLNASKWAEVEQLKAAGERLVQRAQQDQSVAQQFLRDIGYYEVMAQANGQNGGAAPSSPLPASTPRAASVKRKVTKGKSVKGRG